MLEPFEIHEPASIQEASSMLARLNGEATIYAGGTELLLIMKAGLVHFPHLINIKMIQGLDQVTLDENGVNLLVGPLVTHNQLIHDHLVQAKAPLLAETVAQIANVRVRAMGTVGGNLCFAEPHSDLATLLLCWSASCELRGDQGVRELAMDEFTLGMFETARREDEVLAAIRIPLASSQSGTAYSRFSLHERPTVTVAAALFCKEGQTIENAVVVVGSVHEKPSRLPSVEDLLAGELLSDEVFHAAAAKAAQTVEPVDDLYGSADHKRQLVNVLTMKTLQAAAHRATGEPS